MTDRQGAWPTMHTRSSGLRIARALGETKKKSAGANDPRKFGTRTAGKFKMQRHKATCKCVCKMQSQELCVTEMTAGVSPEQHRWAAVALVPHWLMFGGHVMLWCYAG